MCSPGTGCQTDPSLATDPYKGDGDARTSNDLRLVTLRALHDGQFKCRYVTFDLRMVLIKSEIATEQRALRCRAQA